MIPPLPLDPATEAVAIKLLRHLEWQDEGFSLVFLFADVGPAQSVADWLDERLAPAGKPLQRQEAPASFAQQPDALIEALMATLASLSTAPGAVWLSLHRYPEDEPWNTARRQFLARLNERRYLLERDLKRPLVLVMPVDFRSDARSIAPDIWHVRALSDELRAPVVEIPVTVASAAFSSRSAANVTFFSQPEERRVDVTTPTFDEWRRAVAVDPDSAYLPTGWQATKELIAAQRLDLAESVAQQVLSLAQARLAAAPKDMSKLIELRTRDVFISLDRVGRVKVAQRDWKHAESVFDESLTLCRGMIARHRSAPGVLRDLTVALDSVGFVAQVQGNWARAEAAYGEGLALTRRLADTQSATPDVMHELSVALSNLGWVKEAQAHLSQASTLYEESLAIRRKLAMLAGNSHDSIRNLSVALINVGRVAEARGELTLAASRYRESLVLRRQLVQLEGPSPIAQSDLTVVLDHVGRVAESQGDWSRAEEVYVESLALKRQLAARPGATPDALRDLAASHVGVGRAVQAQRRWVEASAAYGEGLALRRELAKRFGDVPQVQDELGEVLMRLGSMPGPMRRQYLDEAMQIYARLSASPPYNPIYRGRLEVVQSLRSHTNPDEDMPARRDGE